jgi:cysteine-rich repeat protein
LTGSDRDREYEYDTKEDTMQRTRDVCTTIGRTALLLLGGVAVIACLDWSPVTQCDGQSGCPQDYECYMATCIQPDVCGNGKTEFGEQCDDGNTAAGDECGSTCQHEVCGNDIVDPGEQCDDGNMAVRDGCSADCRSDETCGNDIQDPGEECDDGNEVDGDRCSGCQDTSLAGLTVSGLVGAPGTTPEPAIAIDLVPGTLEYAIDLPLSQSSAVVTATVAVPGDALIVAGASVASGEPSAELLLSLGDNPVDIVVEKPGGEQRTYRLTLRRAARLAQYAYSKASNTGAGDRFGESVALSGDTLAVGAALENCGAQGVGGDQTDDSVPGSGAVYVFRRTGTEWQQEAYIKASNTGAFDLFGESVALSGDTLAVGAPHEDSAAQGVGGDQADNTAPESGAVYVFRRVGTEWQQEAYIKASNTGADDWFGEGVALSGDTLAVGAPHEDSAARSVGGNQSDNTASASGAVYVFRRSGTEWRQEAYIKASNTGTSDYFGWSVALLSDTLAVAAWGEDSEAQGAGGNQHNNAAPESGAVYVFRRSGTEWQQEAYIKASNTGVYDYFGWSVALSSDTLAVGADGEDSEAQGVGGNQHNNAAPESGAVYVFRRSGMEWQQEAYIKASNTGAGDSFGESVALSGDTLAVGADKKDSEAQGVGQADTGAVYMFRRVGTEWHQEAFIKASNIGVGDYFGESVALSGDTLAVGADGEDSEAQGVGGDQADDSVPGSGAVYVFH